MIFVKLIWSLVSLLINYFANKIFKPDKLSYNPNKVRIIKINYFSELVNA